MRLLTIAGAKFLSVAYLDSRRLLTAQIEVASGYTHRLWNLSGEAIGRDVGVHGWLVLNSLFEHGAQRYFRRNGLWPDGEELPPPLHPEMISQPHPLMAEHERLMHIPLAFRPDGEAALLVGRGHEGTYGTRLLLRDRDGRIHPLLFLGGAEFQFARAAFSPDGRLAAISGGNRFVAVWDVDARQQLRWLEQTAGVRQLSFTAADCLAVAAGRTVKIWHVRQGYVLLKLPAFRKHVQAAVSPDRTLLAVGSRDGQVGVWDLSTGKCRGMFDWGVGEIGGVAFSPDGSTAAAAGQKGVVIWDVD